MTKEARTNQLIRRAFIAGVAVGALLVYGVNHIELPEPKQKCGWELCDCYDWRGRPLDTVRHCTVHGHSCLD